MEKINFNKTAEKIKAQGYLTCPQHVNFKLPQAREMIQDGLRHFTGDSAVWLPEYNLVAEWMQDNKGRGLLAYGNCGRGKTLLCTSIIPIILNHCCNKLVRCYDATQINTNPDEVLSHHIICIDDIGTEDMAVIYGQRRMVMCEIADAAEKQGKLLLLTTNCSLSELAGKYGERTMDRLVAVTKRINFIGQSLRK